MSDEKTAHEQDKENEKSEVKKTKDVWAIIGKASAVLSLVLAIIAVYTFFYPEKPELSARVYDSTALLPINTISNLETKVNNSLMLDYLNSLPETEFNEVIQNEKEFIKKLRDFEEAKSKEKTAEFAKVKALRQKIRILIFNTGTKEAQSIKIELPRQTTGIYQIDFTGNETKSFERVIEVGNIRPSSTSLVEFWINDASLNAEDININYPDGIIPLRTPYDVAERGWSDDLLLFAFTIENLFIISLIIFAVISIKRDERKKKNEEALLKKIAELKFGDSKSLEPTEENVNLSANNESAKKEHVLIE